MRLRLGQGTSYVLLGALALAAAPAFGAVPESTPHWYGYGDGTLNSWQAVQQPAPGRLSVVPSPTDPAVNVLRVELRQGDVFSGGGARAEVQSRHGTHADGHDGWADADLTQRWYHWSSFLTPTFPVVHDWTVIAQWPSDGGGRPSVSLDVVDGRLSLWTPSGPVWFGATALSTGVWHSFTLGARWSAFVGTGWLSLWVDGHEALRKRNLATEKCCYPHGLIASPWPNYFKMGLYRDPEISEDAVLYDGPMKVAADQATAEQ